MYINKPLENFLEDTASGTPTPGGGSVAALVGSLGAALLCMVANFTVGKPKYKIVEKDVKEILKKAEELKNNLSALIQEDVKAYGKFVQASKMPKKTPQLKKKRTQALQKALKEAAEVPWRTAEASFQVIELSQKLLPKGNPNLVTDIAVGVLLAEAALQSAVVNVEINLSFIKDEKYKKEKKKSLSRILSRASQIKNEVVEKIQKKLAL